MKFLKPSEYQSQTSEIFISLKKKVHSFLPLARVEHIGSSAIEGMVSKGDLDIFLGVDKEAHTSTLEIIKSFGFEIKQGTLRTDELCMLISASYPIEVAIQVVANGSVFENFLIFRDLLQSDVVLKNEYNQLKESSAGLTEDDYRLKKSAFIENILKVRSVNGKKESHIILRQLTLADKNKFLEANDDPSWMKEGFIFAHYWESIANQDFEKFVKLSPDFAKGLHIPPEHVPCTILAAFNEDGDLVGRTSIRHELNTHLLNIGGHVGYAVVPKHRRKGYATGILKESLNYIRKHFPQIKKVLVTCDASNIGSKKTIEANRGVLENSITYEGKEKLRYWIYLSS